MKPKCEIGFVFSGDQFTIVIHDMYGFECFNRNGLEQLMINTLNEQLQYHYNQRIFVNEMLEMVRQSIGFEGVSVSLVFSIFSGSR